MALIDKISLEAALDLRDVAIRRAEKAEQEKRVLHGNYDNRVKQILELEQEVEEMARKCKAYEDTLREVMDDRSSKA